MSINNSQILTILLLKTGKETDCIYFSVETRGSYNRFFFVNWLIFEQIFQNIDIYIYLLLLSKMYIIIHFSLLLLSRAKVKYK